MKIALIIVLVFTILILFMLGGDEEKTTKTPLEKFKGTKKQVQRHLW